MRHVTQCAWLFLFLVVLASLMAPIAVHVSIAEESAASASESEPQEAEDPFQGTRFKEFFKAGNYFEALKELDPLVVRDPANVLYLRYYGITLDRLGRFEDALKAYHAALKNSPDNPSVLYFVALTYFHMNQPDRGRNVFERVVDLDREGFYGLRAKEELKKVGPGYVRFPLSVSFGYEYDTNVRTRSLEDERPLDQTGGRYRMDLRTGYVIDRSKSRLLGLNLYTYQTFLDDDLDEYNITYLGFGEYGIFARKIGRFPLVATLRHTLAPTFLNGGIFTFGNSFYGELRSDVHRRVRLTTSSNFDILNYGGDGSNPPLLSRDQFNVRLTERMDVFLDPKRKYSVFGESSWTKTQARGSLYDSHNFGTDVGLALTLPYKLNFHGSFSYGYENFPHYSLVPVREDDSYGFLISLSRKLTDRLSLLGYFRYLDVDSGSDSFEYNRKLGGFRLTWNYS